MDNSYLLKHDLENQCQVFEFFILLLTWPPTNGLLMDFPTEKYTYFTYNKIGESYVI